MAQPLSAYQKWLRSLVVGSPVIVEDFVEGRVQRCESKVTRGATHFVVVEGIKFFRKSGQPKRAPGSTTRPLTRLIQPHPHLRKNMRAAAVKTDIGKALLNPTIPASAWIKVWEVLKPHVGHL